MKEFEVVRFSPTYQEQVRDLVSRIQRDEFGVKVLALEQPDLVDTQGFFQHGDGDFWCAISDGRVVGTIGLLVPTPEFGVVRKMFVDPRFRGKEKNTAQSLLDHAVDYAQSKNLHRLMLGTIDILHAAIRFYQRNGFVEISADQLPDEFPRMEVDNRFFVKELKG